MFSYNILGITASMWIRPEDNEKSKELREKIMSQPAMPAGNVPFRY